MFPSTSFHYSEILSGEENLIHQQKNLLLTVTHSVSIFFKPIALDQPVAGHLSLLCLTAEYLVQPNKLLQTIQQHHPLSTTDLRIFVAACPTPVYAPGLAPELATACNSKLQTHNYVWEDGSGPNKFLPWFWRVTVEVLHMVMCTPPLDLSCKNMMCLQGSRQWVVPLWLMGTLGIHFHNNDRDDWVSYSMAATNSNLIYLCRYFDSARRSSCTWVSLSKTGYSSVHLIVVSGR